MHLDASLSQLKVEFLFQNDSHKPTYVIGTKNIAILTGSITATSDVIDAWLTLGSRRAVLLPNYTLRVSMPYHSAAPYMVHILATNR